MTVPGQENVFLLELRRVSAKAAPANITARVMEKLRRGATCVIMIAEERTAYRAEKGTGEKNEDIREIFEICCRTYCQQ